MTDRDVPSGDQDPDREPDRDRGGSRRGAPPWWASDAGVAADGAVDDDPLTRHRRARAGARADDPGAEPGPERDGGGGAAAEHGTGAPTPGWWAPAAEAVARLSEDLAATAADNAREARGHRAWQDGAGDSDGRWGGPAAGDHAPGSTGRGTRPADGPDGPEAAHLDVCGVCPICVGLRALGTHRPELVGHLTEAARHLAAAVRSVVDQAAADPAAGPDGPPQGLTRIDLDDLDEDDPGGTGGR